MKDIREVILEFVEREYKLPENVDYDTFDIMEGGYIDSMGLVQFVALLEDDFDIEFSAEELLSPEFRTVGGLERIIRNKITRRGDSL